MNLQRFMCIYLVPNKSLISIIKQLKQRNKQAMFQKESVELVLEDI